MIVLTSNYLFENKVQECIRSTWSALDPEAHGRWPWGVLSGSACPVFLVSDICRLSSDPAGLPLRRDCRAGCAPSGLPLRRDCRAGCPLAGLPLRSDCRAGHQTGTIIAGHRGFPKTRESQWYPLHWRTFSCPPFIESCWNIPSLRIH